jgi:hypothetical protein
VANRPASDSGQPGCDLIEIASQNDIWFARTTDTLAEMSEKFKLSILEGFASCGMRAREHLRSIKKESQWNHTQRFREHHTEAAEKKTCRHRPHVPPLSIGGRTRGFTIRLKRDIQVPETKCLGWDRLVKIDILSTLYIHK